jgi:SOS-response transcriptional repressor LexA
VLAGKRHRLRCDRAFLEAENEAYAPMVMTDDLVFDVWGVVTCVIHPL